MDSNSELIDSKSGNSYRFQAKNTLLVSSAHFPAFLASSLQFLFVFIFIR